MKNYTANPSCLECGEQMLRALPVSNLEQLFSGIISAGCSSSLPLIKDVLKAEVYLCNSHKQKCSVKITTKDQRYWYSL